MSTELKRLILPYSLIVGQENLRRALELAYVEPRIGGILLSGQRGTGKSTAVRSFSVMMYDSLPVTLPINATEDRVVGGWKLDVLLSDVIQQPGGIQEAKQDGLLVEAHGKLLFADEVNLLDDHIVNIILDVTATGVLVIQREERSEQTAVRFTLVGTMNPEEGSLRPQLMDRFGLVVNVISEEGESTRRRILRNVLEFDRGRQLEELGEASEFLDEARQQTQRIGESLQRARSRVGGVGVPEALERACVAAATGFKVEGHRADYVMALAACAHAAIEGRQEAHIADVRAVAPMVLQHRRHEAMMRGREIWTPEDDKALDQILGLTHRRSTF